MRETDDDATTSRRAYLQAAGAVGLASTVGLAGCSSLTGSATGTLATTVKDAPGDISDFESCVVTIEGIWLKAGEDGADDGDGGEAGDDGDGGDAEEATETDADGVTTQDADDVDESDGREYHEFDEPAEADLVKLQNGNSQLVDDREIETGSYAFLQLDVSNVEGTLADGGEVEVDTPGNAPLQFKEAFEVREGQRTTFVADFTPVKRGQTGTYLFQPVASGTEVRYEDVTETESGE
jgi:hypothetical protein